MASMERSRENGVMGRCVVVMSSGHNLKTTKRRTRSDAFECKTCHREFASFQALGGHRASHKRPRLVLEDTKLVTKPKMHECTICGLEFSMGQALGGHMRRHRALLLGDTFPEFRVVSGDHKPPPVMMIMRRSNSCSKGVFGLDLNLTPLENDLALVFGNMVPKVGANFLSNNNQLLPNICA